MPQDADSLVEMFRKNYPDLTTEEEAAIRKHAETDCGIFFRCKFESFEVGRSIGIRFGQSDE